MNKHSSSTRRTTSRRRWSDRILELKDCLRYESEYSQYWSDDVWKNKIAGGGGNRNFFYIVLIRQDNNFSYLRAPQGHSGRNPIDPTVQDNVLIPNTFFEYIYHIGCAVILHSITNSGLIAGGQNSSRERQTVFFTAVNLMNKSHQDPIELDLTKPRLASYKQKWKVLGRYAACSTKRIEVLSNKIERSHLLRYTPSFLYLESNCDEI